MYDKKTIDKIVRKLEIIKNKILLTSGNELNVITDWVIQSKEITKTNWFAKKTTQTVYYIESITYESTTSMMWTYGSSCCTYKGVNTFLVWRNNWLNIREQLKPIGYKLSKIQK